MRLTGIKALPVFDSAKPPRDPQPFGLMEAPADEAYEIDVITIGMGHEAGNAISSITKYAETAPPAYGHGIESGVQSHWGESQELASGMITNLRVGDWSDQPHSGRVTGVSFIQVAQTNAGPATGPELDAVLSDLACINAEAIEDGLPAPSGDAVKNAKRLLPELYKVRPGRYHVSATDRQGVAIEAPGRAGGAVVVECAPLDRVYCFVTVDGNRRRAKYYQLDGLPDEFITRALYDLAS